MRTFARSRSRNEGITHRPPLRRTEEGGRPALVTFTTAGDPDYDTSLAIIQSLPKAGADLIEVGMPFSDPMADGPAVQASGQRALKARQTLNKTLAMVAEFRKGDQDTPIILMGYYNPDLYPRQREVRR